MTGPEKRISEISRRHFFLLILRGLLLLGAAVLYFKGGIEHGTRRLAATGRSWAFLWLVWVYFAFTIIRRFFPNSRESMGCQKQFRKNHLPADEEEKPRVEGSGKGTFTVAALWILFNGVFAALYLAGVLDAGILLLLSLVFSVCDIICILFFCPFQSWIMRNKCCGSCRIYNWDFLMMFTPLIVLPGFYCRSLVLLSLALFLQWEVTYRRYPERFAENRNRSLACVNCREKLCGHKVQLQRYLDRYYEELRKAALKTAGRPNEAGTKER